MKRSTLTALAAAIGLAFGASALANTMMSKADYSAGKKAIAADYKSAKAGCDPLVGNAKDVCVAEARGREKVALAELEATHEPSEKHRYDVRIARADAAHTTAKEKCDSLSGDAKDVCMKDAKARYGKSYDRAGNDKDVCLKEAAAVHTAAVADAKTRMKTVDANKTAVAKTEKADAHANKEIAAARHDAADDKRDAQYAVAKEKCDALSGDAKDVCVKDAKARYGKS